MTMVIVMMGMVTLMTNYDDDAESIDYGNVASNGGDGAGTVLGLVFTAIDDGTAGPGRPNGGATNRAARTSTCGRVSAGSCGCRYCSSAHGCCLGKSCCSGSGCNQGGGCRGCRCGPSAAGAVAEVRW